MALLDDGDVADIEAEVSISNGARWRFGTLRQEKMRMGQIYLRERHLVPSSAAVPTVVVEHATTSGCTSGAGHYINRAYV